MSKLDLRVILQGEQLFQDFKGSMTKNFVALELHDQHFEELYYWTCEGIAEYFQESEDLSSRSKGWFFQKKEKSFSI